MIPWLSIYLFLEFVYRVSKQASVVSHQPVTVKTILQQIEVLYNCSFFLMSLVQLVTWQVKFQKKERG